MNRIVIIGCSGSGKSTLTRALAERTGIPAFHLDMLYWQPGWKPHPDAVAFRKQIDTIIAGERWILDGGFFDYVGPARFERADCVVLFDLPTSLCLYRVVRRWLTYRGGTRPDLTPGCPEKFDWEFYRYIASYRAKELPKGEAQIGEYFRGRVFRVRGEADKAELLQAIVHSN